MNTNTLNNNPNIIIYNLHVAIVSSLLPPSHLPSQTYVCIFFKKNILLFLFLIEISTLTLDRAP